MKKTTSESLQLGGSVDDARRAGKVAVLNTTTRELTAVRAGAVTVTAEADSMRDGDDLTSTAATVTSTAGDATLTVSGGHLSNGAFQLAQPLLVPGPKTWDGPVSGDTFALDFQQQIAANDPLRTGTYSRTLTFTLSTSTP